LESEIDPSCASGKYIVGQPTSVDRSLWWSGPFSISQVHVRYQRCRTEMACSNRRLMPSHVGDQLIDIA
jgi:hypothetical protein